MRNSITSHPTPKTYTVMSQSAKAKNYCFTLNNPEAELDYPPEVGYIVYQEETGEDGTPHYQGYVEFKQQTRITAIKKLGPGWDSMHLEVRRGSQEEAIAYCKKEDTRTGGMTEYGIPARSGVCRTYDSMIESIKDDTFDKEEHLGQYLRHKRAVDEHLKEKKKIKREDLQIPDIVLHEWQEDILTLIKGIPDDRKVYWYYDTKGGTGKSTFTKYLIKYEGAIAISTTVKERVIRAYDGEPVIVMDITRQEGQEKSINYSILETLKNGYGFNTMYDPGLKLWKIPHVIVFSNLPPNIDALSSDRWSIHDITPMEPASNEYAGFASE